MKTSLFALFAVLGMPQPGLGNTNTKSIFDPIDFEEVSTIENSSLVYMAKGVARVLSADGLPKCTAFRVTETHFLTELFCPCVGSLHLDYIQTVPEPEQRRIPIRECVRSLDRDYSYNFLTIAETHAAGITDVPVLPLSRSARSIDQKLVIIGHPHGSIQRLDRSVQCVLVEPEVFLFVNRVSVGHTCDTLTGMEGAPMFDAEKLAVVSVHWAGNYNGRNHALPMLETLERIRATEPDIFNLLNVID